MLLQDFLYHVWHSLCSSSIGQSFHTAGLSLGRNSISTSTLVTMTLGTSPFTLLESCYCCLPCIARLQGCYMPTCYRNIACAQTRCFRQGSHWIGGVSDFPPLPFHRYEIGIGGETWIAALILGASSSLISSPSHSTDPTPAGISANLPHHTGRNS